MITAYREADRTRGRDLMTKLIDSVSHEVPTVLSEIITLGRTLERRADDVLALVDITRAADRYPHELSGGMKQRAAIARALALEPMMLLMDEPFGALDAITRNQLQIELANIHQRTGVTIVLVTHSIQEALYLGDHVMVMTAHPGRIREIVDTSGAKDVETAEFAALTGRLRELLIHREVEDPDEHEHAEIV